MTTENNSNNICECLGKINALGKWRCQWEIYSQNRAKNSKDCIDGGVLCGDLTPEMAKKQIRALAEDLIDLKPTKASMSSYSLLFYCTVPQNRDEQSRCIRPQIDPFSCLK